MGWWNKLAQEQQSECKYDERHGGPYDRGSADSYYRRGFQPHYFVGATYQSNAVTIENMTPEEIMAYKAGYDDNEEDGNFKDWG
jgi:hypothetical protein